MPSAFSSAGKNLPRRDVEFVAAVEVAYAGVGEIEGARCAAGLVQVDQQGALVADHFHVAVGRDHHGRVFIDAQAQLVAFLEHGGQHAGKAAPHQQVLVDEDVVANKTQAGRDLLAFRHAPLEGGQHASRFVEHGAAHDGCARAGAGDDAAVAVHIPQGVEHQGIAAVGTAQGLRDAGLVAAREIGAARLAHGRRPLRDRRRRPCNRARPA